MNDTTIVHISVTRRIAVVTVNGIARMYRLRMINPLDLIKVYMGRDYKYTWLNADTILLTKKVRAVKENLAA